MHQSEELLRHLDDLEKAGKFFEIQRILRVYGHLVMQKDWWERYNDYLRHSPLWEKLKEKVMRRCNRICEGCDEAPAVEVHHLTYEHVFNEFLWELRSVCIACHRRCHPSKL